MKINKMTVTILVAIGIVVVIAPAATYAARVIELPWTKNIYHISDVEDSADTVSVFDDGDNKCYIAKRSPLASNGPVAISCVKASK